MDFYKQLSTFRKNLKMSQETCAEKMQVSVSQYQRYEYGKQSPSIDKVLDLLKRTNSSFDDLLGLSSQEEENKKVDSTT